MNNNELLQAMSLMMDEKFGKRFDAIENRLDNMDKRFENMDMRLNNIQEEIVLIHRNIADINDVINKDIKVQLNIIRENYVPASQRYMMEVERIGTMEEDIKGLKSIVAEKTAEWMKPKKK